MRDATVREKNIMQVLNQQNVTPHRQALFSFQTHESPLEYLYYVKTITAWLNVYTRNTVIWLAGFWNIDHLYISV